MASNLQSINQLQGILSDLKILFKKNNILAKDFTQFLTKIKSREVKNYLASLSKGSKPETILREVFFTLNSSFAQYLFKDVFPEVYQEDGFFDYLIKENREEIALEIKPLYDGIIKKEKTGKVFQKIKKLKLNPSDHTKQILKYLNTTKDYVVLTNLEEWYFFSKSASLNQECQPFGSVQLFDLLEDFQKVKDFWHYLDKQEDLALKEPLDENFFGHLKNWVSELSEVNFVVDENTKTESIINFINKFIFIQCLDSFWVIEKNYIKEEWINIERKWAAKNKPRILRKFLEDINEYFYELYDTELFKISEENKTILDFIEHDEDNINLFYQKLKLVLGIEYGISVDSWISGITIYNFRRIDEDILGKSYETFLAEIRKEQGIFYTRKYITQYIVNNVIKNYLVPFLKDFAKSIEKKEYEECNEILSNLFNFKIVDPACGSGSFLIKALRIFWEVYTHINEIIEDYYGKFNDFKGQIIRPDEIEKEFHDILKLKNLLGYDNKRELISKLIIRHIHGVDLDNNAIEVAKLNLWLEAIKLAPKEFRYDRVPADTNHILPDLEMNLCNGDSLVGLPENRIIEKILTNYKEELTSLSTLRHQYEKEPSKIELVRKIVNIKEKIKVDLDKSLREFLNENKIDLDILESTKPFYWPLDFWFVYFDDSLKEKDTDDIGFNAIIGNPPYFSIRGKGTGTLTQHYSYNFLQNAPHWKDHFRSQSDIYYYFTIKSIKLLKKLGSFGFIIESYWLENDYADKLKELMLANSAIKILINFGIAKIFDDADNDTCILIFEKNQEEIQNFKYVYCKKNFSVGTQQQNNERLVNNVIENITKEQFSDEYIDIYLIEQNTLETTKWVLAKSGKKEILEKIENNKQQLGELCKVGQGVVPGRKAEFRISSDRDAGSAGGYWINIDDNYLEVVDKRNNETHRLEPQFIKPLITNSGIKKYYIIESQDYLIYTIPLQDGRFETDDFPGILNYLRVYEQELRDRYDFDEEEGDYPWYGYQRIQNIDLFEDADVKILCPYRATENNFALDEVGYFGTTDVYAILPNPEFAIDINYLLGILNSKVLTFWYKEAGKSKGQILEFFANPLSRIPIYQGSDEEQACLSQLVIQVSTFKKINQKFQQIWSNISQRYRNGKITLESLTLDDRVKVQKGEFDKIWISDISIFPNSENDELTEEFKKFRVSILEEAKLRIYGIKDSTEKLLLELETNISDFRDIIYLEILQLLNSRKKVKNLKHISSKTEISIIKPNIWERSFNLLRYAKAIFERWINNNNIDVELENVVQSDNKIQDLENLIDAIVFKYYSLKKADIDMILVSLNTVPRLKLDIIHKFERLTK